MFDVLLEAALRATLIAAAALVAPPLLRVRSAAVRHRVWTVVLLTMLAAPIWIAWGPQLVVRVLPAARPSAPAALALRPSPALATGDTTMPAAVNRPSAATGMEPRPGTADAAARWDWRVLALALYLAGAAALALRLAIGTAGVRRLTRGARIADGRLTSARIATPFTTGLLRPRVLLPEGWQRWPATRLATVLDHEHEHARRRDPLVQWLALLNRALFWFHPLAWWLERRLSALAEEACDEVVLAHGHAPDEYSRQLLDLARMARGRRVAHVVGVAMPGSALPSRIAKILDGRIVRPSPRWAIAASVALATLAAVAIGSVTLAQQTGSSSLVPPADSYTPLPEYWHDEDEWRLQVAPIMTAEEQQAYGTLRSVEERDRFISAFWRRRDPSPGTLYNDFRTEYERRIYYADQAFHEEDEPGSLGFQTNRGAVYVLLGQPDSVSATTGDDGQPYETWRYADVNGTGDAFAVRIAVARRLSCGPSWEVLEPAPSATYVGAGNLGAAGQLSARVYPLRLVTLAIPAEYGTVQHIRTTLNGPTGDPVLFEFRFAAKMPPALRGMTTHAQQGLMCTLSLPPGDYRLGAEVDLFSGQHLADSVAFQVAP